MTSARLAVTPPSEAAELLILSSFSVLVTATLVSKAQPLQTDILLYVNSNYTYLKRFMEM